MAKKLQGHSKNREQRVAVKCRLKTETMDGWTQAK